MTTNQQKPVHEVRIGRIKASIWANETSAGVRHNVTVRRMYRVESEEGGSWKFTDSLGRDDLLLAGKVLDRAHTWICEQSTPKED